MAIVSKINRDGVDVVIESLQQRFYASLLAYWDAGITYQMYPRANKNYRSENIIPEISLDEIDYSEVLASDKFSVTSFFLNNDSRIFQDEFKRIKQSISIIFQADLVALYGETERMDEQFNMDVLRVLKKENFYIYGDIEIIEGVDNVYRDLQLSGELKDSVNVTDISKQHVVRLSFDVIYKPNCNTTLLPLCAGVSVSVNGTFSEVVPAGGTYNCVTGGGSFDIEINGNAFLSGQTGTVDIPVKKSDVTTNAGAKVGANWQIANSQITVNTVNAKSVLAESTANIPVVKSDGATFAGNWNIFSQKQVISDSVVSNSDDTYTASVLAEDSLELPDTNVKVFLDGFSQGVQAFPTLTPTQVININWV